MIASNWLTTFLENKTDAGKVYSDLTADELTSYFDTHPTGDIVTQKRRRMAIQQTKREEAQVVADSLLDLVKYQHLC